MKAKNFDAVEMMRQIREDLSQKCKMMSYEEQERYLKESINQQTNSSSAERNSGASL
jgi:hypothetical protein